jgi:eukaryotic-like serine/threonine-protein kinase
MLGNDQNQDSSSDSRGPIGFATLRSAFHHLIELEGAARADALAKIAQQSAALAAELTKLLAHADAETAAYQHALDKSPVAQGAIDNHEFLRQAPQRMLGRYVLQEEIGRGGMGVVYRAVRADGAYQQSVAIKCLSFAGSRLAEERFARERQILAKLEHPHIARLLDGSAEQEGGAWLAMELVTGLPITQACDQSRASINKRIQLIQKLIDAVQYAHNHLVIHRDLKPSNVLVNERDELKLLDFGIAKLLEDTDATAAAEQSIYALTPAYAAPEQLARAPITTATDVYGLGLLLGELVSGLRPVQSAPQSLYQRLQALSGNDLAALAQRRALDGAALLRLARSDLSKIIAKATAVEAPLRYPTPAALGEDLSRWLSHRPVLARRPSWGYLLGRFIQRHTYASALSVLALAALIAFSVYADQQAQRERQLRLRADQLALLARDEADSAQQAAAQARSEANANEYLREHFIKVMTRSAAHPDAISNAELRDWVADVTFQSQGASADQQRALVLAVADLFAQQSDAPRVLKILDSARELIAQGSERDRQKAELFRAQATSYVGRENPAAIINSNPVRTYSHSNDASWLTLQGVMKLNIGDISGAITTLEQAADKVSQLTGTSDALSRGALYSNLAIAYLKAGRLSDAHRALDQTEKVWAQANLTQSSQRSASLNVRGFVLMAQGRARDALAHYELIDKSITVESTAARAARVGAHARALVLMGRIDAANRMMQNVPVEMCKAMGESSPLCARLQVAAAEVALHAGNVDAAIKLLASAQKVSEAAVDPGLKLVYQLTNAIVAVEQNDSNAVADAIKLFQAQANKDDRGYRALEYALYTAQRLRLSKRDGDARLIAAVAVALADHLELSTNSVHLLRVKLWRAELATKPVPSDQSRALMALQTELGRQSFWCLGW